MKHDGTQPCLPGTGLFRDRAGYYLRRLDHVRGVGYNVWTRQFLTGYEMYLDWM